jgi:hypothetical protein
LLPPPTLEEQQAEAAARQAEADAEGMWRPSSTAKAKPRNAGARRVISDCHFGKTATEYDRKTGIKWLSCTDK